MRKFRLILYVAFFIIWASVLIGQNVKIKGLASGYQGKEIALYTFDDLITYSITKVSNDSVSADGKFELSLSISYPQAVLIKSGNCSGKMYLQPNFIYGIEFGLPDSSKAVGLGAEQTIDISIIGDSTELNARIIDFNTQFDKFWEKNYKSFVSKRIHSELDSFYVSMKRRYKNVKLKYFQTYIDYTFASFNENSGRHHNQLAKSYLIGKPVHHTNYEYMEFFNSFFRSYLQKSSLNKDGNELLAIINYEGNYSKLVAHFLSDPVLKSDTIRELVMLKNLYELYYTPDFDKTRVRNMIEQINNQTTIDIHKKISSNMLRKFSFLQPGYNAPDFTLSDQNGKPFTLSDMKGRFVYLGFWAPWCNSCLQEMKMMEKIKQKYGERVTFISVMLEGDQKQLQDFTKQNPKLFWVHLNGTEQSGIKAKYNVRSVPSFFLINPAGQIIQSPALMPSEGIEKTFEGLFKPKKGRVGK